jgi:hypothetical protein
VAAGPNVIGGGQLARHDCMKHRASFEILRQCRREGFSALKHRLASAQPWPPMLPGHGLVCAADTKSSARCLLRAGSR